MFDLFNAGEDALRSGLRWDVDAETYCLALLREGTAIRKDILGIRDFPLGSVVGLGKLENRHLLQGAAYADDLRIKNAMVGVPIGAVAIFLALPGSIGIEGINIAYSTTMSGLPYTPSDAIVDVSFYGSLFTVP